VFVCVQVNGKQTNDFFSLPPRFMTEIFSCAIFVVFCNDFVKQERNKVSRFNFPSNLFFGMSFFPPSRRSSEETFSVFYQIQVGGKYGEKNTKLINFLHQQVKSHVKEKKSTF
jgi:hypothetical protein